MFLHKRLSTLSGIAVLIALLVLLADGRPAGIVHAGSPNVGTTTSGPTTFVPTTLAVMERSNDFLNDDEAVGFISWSQFQLSQVGHSDWTMYYLIGCDFLQGGVSGDDLIAISYRVAPRLAWLLPTESVLSLPRSGWTLLKTVKLLDVISQEPGLPGCFEIYFSPAWFTAPPLTQGQVEFLAERAVIHNDRLESPFPIEGGAGPAAVLLDVIDNPPAPTPLPSSTPVPDFQTQAMLSVPTGGTIYAGNSIQVTGSGFPLPAPGRNVAILTLNPAGTYTGHTPSPSGTDLGTVPLDSTRQISTAVTLPSNASAGSYALTAEVGSSSQSGSQLTVVAQASFTISPPAPAGQTPPPTLSVVGSTSIPPNLAQQTPFQVSGSGWKAGQVQIYLDGPSGTLIATVTADASGHFVPDPATVSINPPSSVSVAGGNHTLVAQETVGGQPLTSQPPVPVNVQPRVN